MRRFLDCVTITGADDGVSPSDLFSLSYSYPFVEWAILVSKRTFGQGDARFPSARWLKQLFTLCAREQESPHIPNQPLSLSLHICGKWCRDICEGRWTVVDQMSHTDCNYFGWDFFDRIQLNFSPYLNDIDPQKFVKGFPFSFLHNKEIIFQVNTDSFDQKKLWTLVSELEQQQVSVAIFYDNSGGVGAEPKAWVNPMSNFDGAASRPIGFAGGLDPLKLNDQLEKIAVVAGNNNWWCWIDAETRIRTENKFNIALVSMFLEKSAPWVRSGG